MTESEEKLRVVLDDLRGINEHRAFRYDRLCNRIELRRAIDAWVPGTSPDGQVISRLARAMQTFGNPDSEVPIPLTSTVREGLHSLDDLTEVVAKIGLAASDCLEEVVRTNKNMWERYRDLATAANGASGFLHRRLVNLRSIVNNRPK